MEQVQLTITLNRVDARALESALEDLERRLKNAGFRVEPVIERPAEGEMGKVVNALIVFVSISLVNESLAPLLGPWKENHPYVQMVHIEVKEPDPPPIKTDEAGVSASSDPPQQKD